MALSETERDRLEDVVDLAPTSNGELKERWGMESGREVYNYLSSNLGTYTYRDDDLKIRPADKALETIGEDEDQDDVEEGTEDRPDAGESGVDGEADHSPSAGDDGSETTSSDQSGTPNGDTTADTPEGITDQERELIDGARSAGYEEGFVDAKTGDSVGTSTADEPSCPDCGASAGMSRDQLESGQVYRCDDCGARLRWDPDPDDVVTCPDCGAVDDRSPEQLEVGEYYQCDDCETLLEWDPVPAQ